MSRPRVSQPGAESDTYKSSQALALQLLKIVINAFLSMQKLLEELLSSRGDYFRRHLRFAIY